VLSAATQARRGTAIRGPISHSRPGSRQHASALSNSAAPPACHFLLRRPPVFPCRPPLSSALFFPKSCLSHVSAVRKKSCRGYYSISACFDGTFCSFHQKRPQMWSENRNLTKPILRHFVPVRAHYRLFYMIKFTTYSTRYDRTGGGNLSSSSRDAEGARF